MRIKHIEAIPLVRKLEDVFQGGTYKITSRNTIVTRVELDNGVAGETFGGDEEEYQIHACRIVNEIFRPLLVGGDVRDVEAHWERMWTTRIDLNNRGIHTLDLAKHCVHTQAIAAGVTEWRRIAGMAHSFGVAMAHHEEPQVALHLLAGVPNSLCVEIFPNYNRDPMWFDLPEQQPAIRDGFMHIPDAPGFGIQLRTDTIEKWRVR